MQELEKPIEIKPKCPYCNKELELTYIIGIWKHNKSHVMSFCSFICAENYQMGCEG